MKQIRSTKSYGRSKYINSRVGPVERTDVQASLSLRTVLDQYGVLEQHTHPAKERKAHSARGASV